MESSTPFEIEEDLKPPSSFLAALQASKKEMIKIAAIITTNILPYPRKVPKGFLPSRFLQIILGFYLKQT